MDYILNGTSSFPLSEKNKHTIRQFNDLCVPQARNDSGLKAATVSAPKLWTNLLSFIKNLGSLEIFKLN